MNCRANDVTRTEVTTSACTQRKQMGCMMYAQPRDQATGHIYVVARDAVSRMPNGTAQDAALARSYASEVNAMQVPGKILVRRDGLRFLAIAADIPPDTFFGVQYFASVSELEVRFSRLRAPQSSPSSSRSVGVSLVLCH